MDRTQGPEGELVGSGVLGADLINAVHEEIAIPWQYNLMSTTATKKAGKEGMFVNKKGVQVGTVEKGADNDEPWGFYNLGNMWIKRDLKLASKYLIGAANGDQLQVVYQLAKLSNNYVDSGGGGVMYWNPFQTIQPFSAIGTPNGDKTVLVRDQHVSQAKETLLENLWEFMLTLYGSKRFVKLKLHNYRGLAYCVIILLQMTEQQVHTWLKDAKTWSSHSHKFLQLIKNMDTLIMEDDGLFLGSLFAAISKQLTIAEGETQHKDSNTLEPSLDMSANEVLYKSFSKEQPSRERLKAVRYAILRGLIVKLLKFTIRNSVRYWEGRGAKMKIKMKVQAGSYHPP
ncbi:unnamed protein product [Cuscuta epithymum]|uniref:Uncharacterized protein n=1 Tax=Cuscuta epithymum TaxID=186058 RepID=A0AAV0DRV4_9ASTE|nr:unnamed protein product [Cuscuta epithymum]